MHLSDEELRKKSLEELFAYFKKNHPDWDGKRAVEGKTPEAKSATDGLTEQGRNWLIETYRTEQQQRCDYSCQVYEGRVRGGEFDLDPRLLGYVHGLKSSVSDNKG